MGTTGGAVEAPHVSRRRPGARSWMAMVLVMYVLVSTIVERATAAKRPLTRGVVTRTAYACEEDVLYLECQKKQVIRILNANYGRFTISMCNKDGVTDGLNLQCRYPKSKDIISERCDGRQKCQMLVNNHVFGEACPGTSKYAEVKYNCQAAPSESRPRVTSTPVSNIRRVPDTPRRTLNSAPDPPLITHAEAIGPTQILLKWTQIKSKKPIIATVVYFMEKADLGKGKDMRSFYSDTMGFVVIKNLRPNATFDIYLQSFNSYSPSIPSNTVRVATPPLITTTKPPPVTTASTHPTSSQSTPNKSPNKTTSAWITKPGLPATARPKPSEGTEGEDGDVEVDPFNQKNKGRWRFCKKKEVDGVMWPRTPYGNVAEQPCPKHLTGMSTWVCLLYGWEKNGPDDTQCTSQWMPGIDQQINNVLDGSEEADKAVESLRKHIESKDLTAGDLSRTATKLLPKLSRGMVRDRPGEGPMQWKRRLNRFKQAFMKTSSSLLAERQAGAWRHLPRHECRKAATSLILAVEDTGYQTATMMDEGATEVTIDENIVMEVNVLGQQELKKDVRFPSQGDLYNSPWEGLRDSIVIPSSSLKRATQKGRVNIVFTIYKNLGDLIQPESSPTDPASSSTNTIVDGDDSDGSGPMSTVIINSKIISASINSPTSHWDLPDPVQFTLHHLEENKEATPMCSFWDMDESTLNGSWSQKGCRVIGSNSTHTKCECDHLTNFAVLMDVSGQEMSEDHELALRVITYVGCVISVVCLMISWITFISFKNIQCDRTTIHKNLVLCLMIAEIIFLAGIVQTQPKLLCSIIAGLLHYFFLGAFAWMCLEGVQLYVMLVEVFELEKSRVHWYYLFGYGLPAVIVAVSAGIKHGGYGTDKHCWLSNDNYFIWSFIGPALIVMLINLGMLSIAICTMCRHSNVSATMKERSKVAKFKAWMKGAVVLVVLLGLTWILGVFYLSQESLVMAYAFTILNSLQGLFIFVFHCLMNEKVQKEYRKCARRTSWLPNCIRVNYGGYAGVSSTPNASTGSGNYFSKLFGQRRRKQSATSTNSSMKPFINRDQYRRSDTTENSSSRDSSTTPSSLNGYVYTPHSFGYNNNHHPIIPYNNNGGLHKPGMNNHIALEPCYETIGEGMAGELSEFIDCSMVDSEMVSEYCKNNLQVCREQRRYSTGSENSGYEVPRDIMELQMTPQGEVDGISNLSCGSSMKKPTSSFVSTSDIGARSDLDITGVGQEDDQEEDERSLDLHLDKYIIPNKQKNEFDCSNDQKSSSMNKLSKPALSFTGVCLDGETPSSPHHSSSPNIEFHPGFSTFKPCNPAPAPIIQPTRPDQRQSPSSLAVDPTPSSLKVSLPDMPHQVNGDVTYSQKTPPKRRPSSEADLPYSSFRVSASDC